MCKLHSENVICLFHPWTMSWITNHTLLPHSHIGQRMETGKTSYLDQCLLKEVVNMYTSVSDNDNSNNVFSWPYNVFFFKKNLPHPLFPWTPFFTRQEQYLSLWNCWQHWLGIYQPWKGLSEFNFGLRRKCAGINIHPQKAQLQNVTLLHTVEDGRKHKTALRYWTLPKSACTS